jgi:CRISPR/Cas system-associated exonuclease Cas4 (RecB family)
MDLAIPFHPLAPRTVAWDNAGIPDLLVDRERSVITIPGDIDDQATVVNGIRKIVNAAMDELRTKNDSRLIPPQVEQYFPPLQGVTVRQNQSGNYTITFPMLKTQEVNDAIEIATAEAQRAIDSGLQRESIQLAREKEVRDMREQYRRDCQEEFNTYGYHDGPNLSDSFIDVNIKKGLEAQRYCKKSAQERRLALIDKGCQKAYDDVEVAMPQYAKHRDDLLLSKNAMVEPYGYCFAQARRLRDAMIQKQATEDGKTCQQMFEWHNITTKEVEEGMKQIFKDNPDLINNRVEACETLRDMILKQREDAKAEERRRMKEAKDREDQRKLEALEKAEKEERLRQEQMRQQELEEMRARLEEKAKQRGFQLFVIYKAMQAEFVSFLKKKALAIVPDAVQPTEKDNMYNSVLNNKQTLLLIAQHAAEQTTYKQKTIDYLKRRITSGLWMKWRGLQTGVSKYASDPTIKEIIKAMIAHQEQHHDNVSIDIHEKLEFEHLLKRLKEKHALISQDTIALKELMADAMRRDKEAEAAKAAEATSSAPQMSLAEELALAAGEQVQQSQSLESLELAGEVGRVLGLKDVVDVMTSSAEDAGGEVPRATAEALSHQREFVKVQICAIAKQSSDKHNLREMLLKANLKVGIDEALEIASTCGSVSSDETKEVQTVVARLQDDENISKESKAQLGFWSQLLDGLLEIIWSVGKSAVDTALGWLSGWRSPVQQEEEEEDIFADASDKPAATYAGHGTRRRSRRRRQSGRHSHSQRRPSGVRRRRSRRPSRSKRRPSRSKRRPSGARRRRSRRPSLRV